MDLLNTYDNFIFDLYGTLIDIHTDETAGATWRKFSCFLNKNALKHPPYFVMRKQFFTADREKRAEARIRDGFEYPEIDVTDIYREMLLSYGNSSPSDEFLRELAYAFREASRDYVRLFPGTAEFLKLLKDRGKKVFILSNAQAGYTVPEIEMFSLEKITDGIVLSSDECCMKPERAFFECLLERYGLDRDKCVMFGDNALSDIRGAENAGIAAVHLSGENHPKDFYSRMLREYADRIDRGAE